MPDQQPQIGATEPQVQACDVAGCGHPSVVLLANDAALDSPEYREWYACRWHQRNTLIAADALALPVTPPMSKTNDE